LNDQQQQALLDAFESRGADDDSTDSTGLGEADRTIASLQSSGDADNVFLGLDADSATARQTQ
jgi:hypothetical protein